MMTCVVLDSSPLALLVQRVNVPQADAARGWLKRLVNAGVDVVVPEIVDYELRRELLRLGKSRAIAALDALIALPGRYRPITTQAMKRAAELWADTRRRGMPTAHEHELDVDVILSAQVLSMQRPSGDVIVATGNVAHLSRFVRAEVWHKIV